MNYTKEIFLQLDNLLQFRLTRLKEIERFFIPEVNGREKMRNTLNKYITALAYKDKVSLILPGVTSGVSLSLFTTVIGTTVAPSKC